MAKKTKQQDELELEDNKKTEDTDGAEEVVVAAVQDQEVVKGESDAEKRVKELTEQIAKLDAEKNSANERAERLEKERAAEAAKAQGAEKKAATTQKDALYQAITSAEQAIIAQRKEYKLALEAGDSDRVVEAQEKLSEAVYVQSELKRNKAQFDQWEKQQEEAAKQPKETKLPPSVNQWIARNPKYNSDPEFKVEADSAHDAAVRYGYAFGSPAYIEFLDKRIDKIFGKEDAAVADDPPKKERDASYSAPPSRGSSSDVSTGGKKIYKLTPEEREAAGFMNMTEIEYAKLKEAEKARGAR
jgi:hypothetical protein